MAHVAVEEEDDDVDLVDDGKPTREALLDMMGFCTIDVSGIDLLETGTQTKPKKVSFADIVQNGVSKASPETKRLTLDAYKLYLDSCATYHSVFVEWCLDNITTDGVVLRGDCNAGVTTSTQVDGRR